MVDIFNRLKLKPGEYKARLLMFGSVYNGTNSPTEIIKPFTIVENGAQRTVEEIDLSVYTDDITYVVDNNARIRKIDFTNNLKKSDRLKELIATKQFVKSFGRTRHFTQLVDSNGTLSKALFEKKFSWRNRQAKAALRFIRNYTWNRKRKHSNTCL